MNKKRVLVTGAGSGIGRGLALGLAEKGFDILASDLNSTAVKETVEMINKSNGSGEWFELDVSSDESIERLVNSFLNPVDVLINNAGLQYVSKLEDFPQNKWELLINVMLNGTARMTRALLPGMKETGFGRIINIGSIHSIVASPYKSAYVAAKHGILGFSKTLALETADTDITINTICPSYVKTPLVEEQIADQAKEYGLSEEDVINEIMLKPMPKGKFIGLDELVGISEFLISPTARNITGQEIVVDGGWTIR
ncbi:MAG: 3-hydroxybutyrate dehydrogenase [Bacteroidota bacterium]